MLGSFGLLILPELIGFQLHTYEYHGFRIYNELLSGTRLVCPNEV